MTVCFDDVGVCGERGRWLLKHTSVRIEAGHFVGVLGPSGSGKSLFLELLGTLRSPQTGRIHFDDEYELEGQKNLFREQLGQVPQHDLVFPWLTVEENLQQAASIRLPEHPTPHGRQRCEQALKHVDLIEHRHTLTANLSGGQRRRLSVAVELLREPRLLVLDEPTSGLDPAMQGQLMDLLRTLARRGMTVVCSTHTLDTMNHFDSLIVVGKREGVGTVCYTGEPALLLTHFGVRTASDLYTQLQHLAHAGRDVISDAQADESNMEEAALQADARDSSQSIEAAPATSMPELRVRNHQHVAQQAWTVFHRSWLGFRRDRMALLMSVFQPLVLATLVVISQHNKSYPINVHFFLVVCAIWMGMTLTVREIVRERPLYQRDRLAGLHPDAYLLGRASAALLPLAVQVLLLWVIARLLVHLLVDNAIVQTQLLETSWLRSLAVLYLSGLGGLLIGLLISVLARSERAAVAMLPIAILPQFLLSRVAAEDPGRTWDERSPFMPLVDLVQYVRHGMHSAADGLLTIGSLPMISRPATGSFDINQLSASTVTVEWLYLILLLLCHMLVVYVCFHRREGVIQAR